VGSRRTHASAKKAADLVGSLLTALLAFGATPVVLVTVVGDPLSGGLGHQLNHDARVGLAAVVLVAWVAWVACCSQLIRSVIAQVRRGHISPASSATLTERIAARLAAGVLTLTALAAPVALTATAGAATTAPRTESVVPGTSALPAHAPAPVPVPTTYVVRPGDSLWSIADAQLGDGSDWPAIAALNLGRMMPDGLRFVDPSRIYAGWTLLMPAPPTTDISGPALPPDPVAPSAAPPAAPTETPAVPVSYQRAFTVTPHHAKPDARAPASGLPELAALGIGAIACAALARRSRRARLLRQLTPPADEPEFVLPARAIDTEVLLARFSGVPALHAFEAANCRLADALCGVGPSERRVGIRAVCVGAAGVDFWLCDPGRAAPAGFSLTADGRAWHAAHEDDPSHDVGRPYLPIVLPIGEDGDGTWLVPVQPGICLPLLGEAAGALWRAARPVQEAWAWADTVLVTADPDAAANEVGWHDASAIYPDDTPHVLFFGDPTLLPESLARAVSVVTLAHVPASDVAVLADHRAASIHPLARTVRPHLLGHDSADAVGQLVATPLPDDAARPAELRMGGAAHLRDEMPLAAGSHAEGGGTPDGPAPPSPGTVEVRLLTPTPRLDGLRAALAPNRARRAVELVAYLALHHDEEVTSDRLRSRVLGSSDADAASKTLFNIATAARRAMGTDAAGVPLLPPGTRSGHYHVTDAVTVDAHRAATLAAEGRTAEDPEVAMALLRAALGLVEGEPLANALSGYTWWEAEGHGARIAAVLVDAASDLARLAVSAGLYDLARWGLARARLVDPYSEAISRAAMQVAAAASDADGLRREWRECQRRIDELDPGSAPSPRTERLYDELARRVLVGAVNPDR
jgi:DNA-binding SARP family transcriptional activator